MNIPTHITTKGSRLGGRAGSGAVIMEGLVTGRAFRWWMRRCACRR
jgi:hypothetical protein